MTSFALTYMRTFSFQPHNQWAGYIFYQYSPVSQTEAQRDQGTCTSQGSMGSFCLSVLSLPHDGCCLQSSPRIAAWKWLRAMLVMVDLNCLKSECMEDSCFVASLGSCCTRSASGCQILITAVLGVARPSHVRTQEGRARQAFMQQAGSWLCVSLPPPWHVRM